MADIHEVAVLLGTDANGVLNELVVRGLSELLSRARDLHRELLKARIAKDTDFIPSDDAVLRAALIAGRAVPLAERVPAMELAVRKAYRKPYPTPELLAQKAIQIDDCYQRAFQLQLMLANPAEWKLEKSECELLVKPEGRLQTELERLLLEWERFLNPESESKGESDDSGKKTQRSRRGKHLSEEE